MANLEILRSRLLKRLPGRTNTELDGWLEESALQHKFSTVAEVPAKKENAILAYAEYVGIKVKAVETAEKASINVDGVSINKSSSSSNYERLVKEAWATYKREARAAGIRLLAGGFVTGGSMVRVDGR